MATLRVIFTPASPAPAIGYIISYRRVGTGDSYSSVTSKTSPVDITVIDGYAYEGFIRSDCGGGKYSNNVPFSVALPINSCYIYTFTNTGTSLTKSISYKLCGQSPVSKDSMRPGESLEICCSSDYVFVMQTQVPPGTDSTVIQEVSVTRRPDASCAPITPV